MDTDFEKGNTVWMTSIDEDGMCGREYHPDRSDIGCLAEVVYVNTFHESYDGDHWTYHVLKCLTYGPDPKFLELCDYEVQVISKDRIDMSAPGGF